MTRMLSELLGAKEPNFRLRVRDLEKSGGHPSADIRLSVEIMQRTRDKICELGLDPDNTTGEELFETLKQRLLADEQRLHESLGLEPGTTPAQITGKVEKFIKSLEIPRSCFALKHSVAKRLLKKVPPTKAMKHLGYRSLDSMLKHEPVPQIYAAATMYESGTWHKTLNEAYEKLTPSDFEVRQISINCPKTKRWERLAEEFGAKHHHHSLSFKELGAIVILPVEVGVPALITLTTLLALKSINDIRCSSSFLKLQQVKPSFGQLVAQNASGEPFTEARLAGFNLPWNFLHKFFASFRETLNPALFEPHVQPEDLKLAEAEQALAAKLPALEFWIDTKNLALIENGQPVSLNMLDVALNAANSLEFERRITRHLRESVWAELLMRYLNPANLEKVTEQLSAELTGAGTETVPALEAETA